MACLPIYLQEQRRPTSFLRPASLRRDRHDPRRRDIVTVAELLGTASTALCRLIREVAAGGRHADDDLLITRLYAAHTLARRRCRGY
jgi:hypothetical protein